MQIVALYGTRSTAASGKSLYRVEMAVGSLSYAGDLLCVARENTLVSYPILDPCCSRLNSNDTSVGITGRPGMRTSAFDLPFGIVASMTLSIFFNSKSSSTAHSRLIDVAKKNYGRTNLE